MARFVDLNGELTENSKASFSIFERGYLYGEGVFTTAKVREGTPLFIERHLDRLRENCAEIGIKYPDQTEKRINSVIQKNGIKDGGVRITISAGNYTDENSVATCMIYAFTFEGQAEAIDVITVSDMRDIFKGIKTTYRVPHIYAQRKAAEQGCGDAIFSLNGKLIESTNSNLLVCRDDKSIITPVIMGKGLNGITRQVLMEKLDINEEEVHAGMTGSMILINSLYVKAVKSINGRKIKRDDRFVDLIRGTIEKAEKEYLRSQGRKV